MLPVAQYLLKLSISLAVVYLFYVLVLRRLTFHTWNRWYLLGYTAIAFVIPFVDISPVLSAGNWQEVKMVQWVPLVEQYTQPSGSTTREGSAWYPILWWVFGAGMAVGVTRLIIQYYSFARLRRGAELISQDTIKLYHVDQPISPFSFGDAIYVNLHQHESEELQEIIRHEFIHIKQKHTLDILFAELVCLLNWYNPFAWLIRRSIRENLEFIADRHVLQSGIDRKAYQYLLLKVTGSRVFNISHPFSYSSLKKRIVMMNKMKSARIHAIKFLFVLPLATVMLLAFRNHVHAQHVAATKEKTPLKFTMNYTVELDTVPAIKPPAELKSVSVNQFLASYPSVKRVFWELGEDEFTPNRMLLVLKNGRQEEYTLADKESMAGFSKKYAKIPRRAKNGTVDAALLKRMAEKVYRVSMENQQSIVPDDTIIRPAVSKLTLKSINGKQPLILVDDVIQTDPDILEKLDPNGIHTVYVSKDAKSILRYGEQGKNGVVEIYSKDYQEFALRSDNVNRDLLGATHTGNLRPVGLYDFPGLILIGEEEYDASSFKALGLTEDSIASIRFLRVQGRAKYGEKGNNGVAIVTLNK